ncbi:hypothetical protein Tco_0528031 [Tanacetum coccineum]
MPLSKGTGGKRLQVGSKFNLGNSGTKSSSSVRGEARSGYSTFILGTEVLTLTFPNFVLPKGASKVPSSPPGQYSTQSSNACRDGARILIPGNDDDLEDSEDQNEVNKDAVRALLGVKQKLDG